MKTCPHEDCGEPLEGLGTYCWTCDRRTVTVDVRTPAKESEPVEVAVEASWTLPWEVMVSTNKRHGGMAGWSTKEYRAKRDAMADLFRAGYDGAPWEDEVTVSLELYPPDRRSDPHNFCKAIYDALEKAGVVKEDRIITSWHGFAEYGSDEPRAYVEVTRREYPQGRVT